MIDAADVIASSGGDWADAILIVLPEAVAGERVPAATASDAMFLEEVQRKAPKLTRLAEETISAVRRAGIDGQVEQSKGGRWVNRPVRTFGLKVQPRAGNLQFTLYGEPTTYDSDGFLSQDQHGYSRGWIRNSGDIGRFTELARLSHLRRNHGGVMADDIEI